MVVRSADHSLIVLPQFNSDAGDAMVTEILVRSNQAKNLSVSIKEARAELEQAQMEFHIAVANKMTTPDPDGGAAREADKAQANAWSAFFERLKPWIRLPDGTPEGSEAVRILTLLFADGLKFTTLPWKEEWAQAERRIELVKSEKLDATIELLIGSSFWQHVKDTHIDFGKALGITSAEPIETAVQEPTTQVRDAFLAMLDALRGYILRVAAAVSRKDARTAKVADHLLQPYLTWESRRSSPVEAAPAAGSALSGTAALDAAENTTSAPELLSNVA